ncbi:MAG TPA: AMP-binding protein [Alphaproteobacteria bacterium]|nr:AMP-binding protein [Alphaproteobacteria bacterium]
MSGRAAAGAPHYDALETRDPETRERQQFAALRDRIAAAKRSAPGWQRILADVDPDRVTDRASLARLPVTRKSDLVELQRALLPFGGLTATDVGHLRRVFVSPGPIYDPEGARPDYWRFARALYAAGFRAGDLVHNSFSYHLTPGGAMLEDGALALGCAVVPGGVGQTELQLKAIEDLKPSGYTGTPSFLKILVDKARETGADISSLGKAMVSGEALPPSLRAEIERDGISVAQSYASADLGLIAYESSARAGLIVDEGAILEIVRPGTGDPVAEGEVGEVVVSVLNPDYPLIRFATGDLSAYLEGPSPCGRTGPRIKGWMGRADQTAKLRGMFVRPAQIAEVAKRHPEILRARLVIESRDHQDRATLLCETAVADAALARAIGESFQAVAKLRAEVALVAPGAIARDGKVIEDARKYD